MESKVMREFIKDIELYEKHEKNLGDEFKLAKLNDIKERIRGASYVYGTSDKSIQQFLELIHDRESKILNNTEDTSGEALLTIELQDESSAPEVFYKGKEIKHKSNVCFDWETKTDTDAGGLAYDIEHYEVGNERITRNRIERAVGDHAY